MTSTASTPLAAAAFSTHEMTHLVELQQRHFASGATRSLDARQAALRALSRLIAENERSILDALTTDMRRPTFEAYAAEIALVQSGIHHAQHHLARWMKRRSVRTSLINFPACSWVEPEPRGRILILSPWNYPFYLCFEPLLGALAAGNCALLKPSEVAEASATLLAQLIPRYFAKEHVAIVTGGAETAQASLSHPWDLVLYTGNGRIARQVMAACSQTLTPVVLELGGKNPALVDRDADLPVAARRILWGKCFNAGQTCLAPDFLCVQRDIYEPFVAALEQAAQEFFGDDPKHSTHFGRIINQRHTERLVKLLERTQEAGGRILFGGQTDVAQRYVAPTLVALDQPWTHPLMEEEIFGPILPLISFDTIQTLAEPLSRLPVPLACYYFSGSQDRQHWLQQHVRSGGLVFNGVFAQSMSPDLPFGGLGGSGMGRYRGAHSFDTFSHLRATVRRSTKLDSPIAYPPYRVPLPWLRRLLPWLLR